MTQAVRTREWVEFTGADGAVYRLNVPSRVGRWMISSAGLGMPPIDYITQRGPAQHGATVLDYFLQPRTVQLLIRQNFCDREAYWSGRTALLNGIRPNRQLSPTAAVPGTLTFFLPNGDKRALSCFIAQGPNFEPRQVGRWDEWAFQEVLRFTAYDPVFFDPDATVSDFTAPGLELVFPITFPITFGGFATTLSLTYNGNWLEYPVITIHGAATTVTITNNTTGEVITLTPGLTAAQSLTIDLRYGFKTVVRNDGANLIGTVDPDSDLATWHLAPDPEAAGGVNSITVGVSDADAATAVTMTWFARFIGI